MVGNSRTLTHLSGIITTTEKGNTMDIGTAKDMIEDLQAVIASLHEDIRDLQKVCELAYKRPEGYIHHAGCLGGMMCSCGWMHYHAWKESKQ